MKTRLAALVLLGPGPLAQAQPVQFVLQPNPARDRTTLVLTGLPPTATHVQAALFDALGRPAGRHTSEAAGGPVPLAGLAPRLYVVRLTA